MGRLLALVYESTARAPAQLADELYPALHIPVYSSLWGSAVKKIQRIELSENMATIHCPFCGTKVVDGGEDRTDWLAEPCVHTLFVGHDEVFEYASEEFKAHIRAIIEKIEDPEEREEYEDFDETDLVYDVDGLTDRVTLPDSIKFAVYMGPPAQFGSYVAFVALGED